jgi:pimeloyl-ACP methyl ester carboxylesterase
LPAPTASGTFAVADVKLWYATFGEGPPVLLLHGGLGNSAHFSDVIAALVADRRRVIVMDSRGHGRSTRSRRGISYQQMADDVVALLDHLAIERAALLGWSDGGATALDVAIRYPERLNKLFVIGTNYALDGVKGGATRSKTFPAYFARCRREYARLSPDPKQLGAFLGELRAMWASQPTFTDEQIRGIAAPTLVALGEHDEVVRRDHVEKLAKLLPHGKLAVLADVSHFAMWQDLPAFLAVLREFLDEKPAPAAAESPARAKPAAAPPRKAPPAKAAPPR